MLKAIDIENEKSSPHFHLNKSVCLEIEKNLAAEGAMVSGTYGAWSFYCTADFKDNPKAKVAVEKSSYTQDDYSLFQSVFNLSTWTIYSHQLKFSARIRKANILDKLGLSSYSKLFPDLNYYGNCKKSKQDLFGSICSSIKPLMQSQALYYFKIQDAKLILKFEKDHTFLSEFIELRDQFK